MFSELVDRAVHIAGRPDAVEDFAYFLNETVRDVSKRRDWDDETVEELIPIVDGVSPTLYDAQVGRPRFRREHTLVDGCGCEVDKVRPNAKVRGRRSSYYYVSGGSFVLANVCGPEAFLFYYAYPPWLKYYAVNARPAVFDVEAQDYGGATEAQIALVSHWQLERHNAVLLNGTLARFFASKQDPRQQVQYSAYEQGISHMIRGESSTELWARGA